MQNKKGSVWTGIFKDCLSSTNAKLTKVFKSIFFLVKVVSLLNLTL